MTKIAITKDAGYCFGVRDAVNMAYDAAEKYGEVYMLGSIVHNEKVVEDLSNAGAKIVDKAFKLAYKEHTWEKRVSSLLNLIHKTLK